MGERRRLSVQACDVELQCRVVGGEPLRERCDNGEYDQENDRRACRRPRQQPPPHCARCAYRLVGHNERTRGSATAYSTSAIKLPITTMIPPTATVPVMSG